MSIPSSQLDAWSSQGAVDASIRTHTSIRACIDGYTAWRDSPTYDVYLQGSYRNSTNIRGDSDVDVVVELTSVFRGEVEHLPVEQQERFNRDFPDAPYSWLDFRADILAALQQYYGTSAVSEQPKCLRVSGNGGRLSADVVVALQYVYYFEYAGPVSQTVEGIRFFASDLGNWIVNFPKQHIQNGFQKNANVNGEYKPTVRIFKNMRSLLRDRGLISIGVAPSYFLECLLYNAPSRCFAGESGSTVYSILDWLNSTDLSDCECQNGLIQLFGAASTQWSLSNAQELVRQFIALWHNW